MITLSLPSTVTGVVSPAVTIALLLFTETATPIARENFARPRVMVAPLPSVRKLPSLSASISSTLPAVIFPLTEVCAICPVMFSPTAAAAWMDFLPGAFMFMVLPPLPEVFACA